LVQEIIRAYEARDQQRAAAQRKPTGE
jgi:hypothetical protein